MRLLPPEKIVFNYLKYKEIKSVMESTFRLIMFSRKHLADDLLNAYLDQTTNFKELLSIKNAQMEAQNETEAKQYALLLNKAVDFITDEIQYNVNFLTEVQLFQLFRIISPEAHASHPNRYRDQLVQIGRYICPEPKEVPALVNQLFHRMNSIDNPISRAIYFHHEMIRIHPFSDGNGRTIRMAKNWMLMHDLYPPIFISDSDEKTEYITSLENSFDYLLRNGASWNEHLAAFFEQELNRLLRNAITIHDKVRVVGNMR